jgi:dGTPase
MIDAMVSDLINTTRRNVADSRVGSVAAVRGMGRPLVGLSPEMARRNAELKSYLHRHLYQHHRIERMKDKSRRILEALYQRYFENPRLLPDDTALRVEKDGLERTIADYIAGMTDRYAIQEHRRLFDPSVRV